FNGQRAETIVDAAEERVDDQEFTVWLITALGLTVVAAVSLLCWGVTRSLRRRLMGLHHATVELAQKRLPSVIARLSRGEQVDGAALGLDDLTDTSQMPELPHGNDEIGQVAAAFGTAERAAVDGAVRLAREREGYAKVFHNVALRTQSLVGRQLRVLDAMESRHQDPELLEDLFLLDHLATRLRRYEENLVILSGHQPGRRWSKPVRMVDVVRSAVGEVEDYARVNVRVASDLSLAGPAVGGVIHLLAELLENSTKFSPPDTPVEVRGMPVATGLAVEIEDRGLGMGAEEYETLNAELAQPTPFDMVALADDLRLGLFVVAQLAQRYGINVALRPSPYGGTLAIVLIPRELIIGPDGSDDADTPEAGESADDSAPTASGEPTDGAEPAEPGEPLPQATPATVTRLSIPAPSRGSDADEATGPDAAADTDENETVEAPVGAETAETANPAGPSPAAAAPSETAPATPPAGNGRPKPLPRRVRQANLAAPLREARADESTDAESGGDAPARPSPREAAATISAFQRASERARATADVTTERPKERP
ncbi:MAG TPA: ATP-binding protein, partial [Yinghuangia sp.]|nr:ATP-binding protein [Yinghuangia sp.]